MPTPGLPRLLGVVESAGLVLHVYGWGVIVRGGIWDGHRLALEGDHYRDRLGRVWPADTPEGLARSRELARLVRAVRENFLKP